MDEGKLINIGKALVDMLSKINTGANVSGTSLEMNQAFFEWDGQIYRMHLSKLEEPWIYTKGLRVVEDEDDNEEVDKTQSIEPAKETGNDKV